MVMTGGRDRKLQTLANKETSRATGIRDVKKSVDEEVRRKSSVGVRLITKRINTELGGQESVRYEKELRETTVLENETTKQKFD